MQEPPDLFPPDWMPEEPPDLFMDEPDFTDDAIWEARDRLLDEAFETVGVELEREDIDERHELREVLRGAGIDSSDFDPTLDPPPLFDENSNTAYWIGVFQPDESNPDEAITSILAISQDENGACEAHLAPVASGVYEQASAHAQELLDLADETQDIDRVFDAAESISLNTQQHTLAPDLDIS